MKHLTLLSLLAMSTPVWAATSAPAEYWSAGFNNGRFPDGVTTALSGQNEPIESRYKHGFTGQGWTVANVGNDYCATCPTSTGVAEATDASLQLPAIEIADETAVIRWRSRSILPSRPESFVLQCRETGDEKWTDVLAVKDENPYFTTHAAPLAMFTGKQTEIRFLCTTMDGYMLAVDDIFVGVDGDLNVEAVNLSPRFAENASPRSALAMVKGVLTNTGSMEIPAGSQIVAETEGTRIGNYIIDLPLATGTQIEFSFPINAADDSLTPYRIDLMTPDGTSVPLAESDVFRSAFARNLLIDEGTGTWCVNCPEGIMTLDNLEREYPGQVNIATTHVNDVMANAPYWANLTFYAVPYFMLDRNRDTAASDTRNFSKVLQNPTQAEILPGHYYVSEDGSELVASLKVTFAEQTDNSDDRYGIGYVIKSDFHNPTGSVPWSQKNNCSTSRWEQYYFLPSVIPADLSYYKNVTLTSENSFTPVENSLPATLGAYETNTADITLQVPESEYLEDITETRLIAYVLDRKTGNVLNSTEIKFGEPDDSGIDGPVAKESGKVDITVSAEGNILFDLGENATHYVLTVSDAAGRILSRTESTAAGMQTVAAVPLRGIAIISLTTDHGSAKAKVIRK